MSHLLVYSFVISCFRTKVATWNASDWRALGQNIRGLTVAEVRGATMEGVAEICRVLDIDYGTLDDVLKAAAAEHAIELLGAVGGWETTQLQQYAMLLPAMNASTLSEISLDGIITCAGLLPCVNRDVAAMLAWKCQQS